MSSARAVSLVMLLPRLSPLSCTHALGRFCMRMRSFFSFSPLQKLFSRKKKFFHVTHKHLSHVQRGEEMSAIVSIRLSDCDSVVLSAIWHQWNNTSGLVQPGRERDSGSRRTVPGGACCIQKACKGLHRWRTRSSK